VFCVSIVRKLLPRGKTAPEQFIPPVACDGQGAISSTGLSYKKN